MQKRTSITLIFIVILFFSFSSCSLIHYFNEFKYREDGVFVSINRGNETNDGSLEKPVKNIQTGVNIAVTKGFQNVYVEEGGYSPSNGGILNTGVDITGSFINLSGGWQRADKYDFAYQWGETVLDMEGNANSAINVNNASNIKINKFTVCNALARGVLLNNAYNSRIKNCYIHDNISAINGGGIMMGNCTYVSVEKCRIQNNTASTGAGIYIGMGNGYNIIDKDTVISGNTANVNGGGGICILSQINRNYIYAEIHNNDASTDGGGIDLIGSTDQFIDATISSNTSDYGGGIYLDISSNYNTITGTIKGNNSTYSGGGIYIAGNYNTVNANVSNNTSQSGGGIYIVGTYNHIYGNISNNRASLFGGGLLDEGSYDIIGTDSPNETFFVDNSAGSFGDNIYILPTGDLTLKNIFFRNSNGKELIYFSINTPSIKTLIVTNNTFSGNGTGIFFHDDNSYPNYSFTNNSFSSSLSPLYLTPAIGPLYSSLELNTPASTQATPSSGNTVF